MRLRELGNKETGITQESLCCSRSSDPKPIPCVCCLPFSSLIQNPPNLLRRWTATCHFSFHHTRFMAHRGAKYALSRPFQRPDRSLKADWLDERWVYLQRGGPGTRGTCPPRWEVVWRPRDGPPPPPPSPRDLQRCLFRSDRFGTGHRLGIQNAPAGGPSQITLHRSLGLKPYGFFLFLSCSWVGRLLGSWKR